MTHYDYSTVDDFLEKCQAISETKGVDEAFALISADIDSCSDRYLNDFIGGLNYVRSKKSLDWIEANISRTKNVSQSWGHVSASSHFTWDRAKKWIDKGRPLSLVALDGLMFCTTIGKRLNQSPWMRTLNPSLEDDPKTEEVKQILLEYLKSDNAPRTKRTIERIIDNLENKQRHANTH
jgi:hypothetical protein